MTINIEREEPVALPPIKRADFQSYQGAELWAERHSAQEFKVAMLESDLKPDGNTSHWYFTAKCCRDAAEFFNKLATELERARWSSPTSTPAAAPVPAPRGSCW